MLRAVIYDMDGTLVDSEGAIALAGKEALVDWGIECQLPDFKPFTGMGDDKFIGGVAEKYGVKYTPDTKYISKKRMSGSWFFHGQNGLLSFSRRAVFPRRSRPRPTG